MTVASNTVRINWKTFETTSIKSLELHADYVCGRTGVCCSQPWNILLPPPDRNRLTAAMAAAGLERPAIDRHFEPSRDPNHADWSTFATQPDGPCIFLGREGGCPTCGAQRDYGHEAIPAICQAFPRLAMRTPAGVYLNLTYTCPTAAKLLAKPDGLREVNAREIFAHRPELAGSMFETSAPPKFSDRVTPTWESFDYVWRWSAQWMARDELQPAHGLYWLGAAVERIEALDPTQAELSGLIELLDGFDRADLSKLRTQAEAIEAPRELGPVYFESLLRVALQAASVPPAVKDVWREILDAGAGFERARFLDEYNQRIRPHLAEFDLIERNFIGSRLYVNTLTYQTPRLRTGYLTIVIAMIALRFNALGICMAEDLALTEDVWFRAAGMVDHMLMHDSSVQDRLIEVLDEALSTPMQNLCLPALF